MSRDVPFNVGKQPRDTISYREIAQRKDVDEWFFQAAFFGGADQQRFDL